MDFLTQREWDEMTKETNDGDFILDTNKMKVEKYIKTSWAKEIEEIFGDVESGKTNEVTMYVEPKRNFWQRLKYLFTGK